MKKANPNSKAFQKILVNFLHTLGNNLYALRINRKATLKTVSEAIKISRQKLSRIEKGLCPRCKFDTLILLCRYYKVSMTDIATKGKFKVRKNKTRNYGN